MVEHHGTSQESVMYNKLFSKILDSSIWLETDSTRIVWVTLLATMDEDGFCAFACAENVANRARVSSEAAEAALKALESPDPNSGDSEHEGRRIERVPGGWFVLNGPKYREIAARATMRANTRKRVQAFRERKRNAAVTPGNGSLRNQKHMHKQESSCAELEKPAPAPPILLLPCQGQGPQEYPVRAEQVREWTEAFPAVDVLGELKKAKAWLKVNPKKRKTYTGMVRFIVNWLSKAQDRPSASKPNPNANTNITSSALDYQAELLRQANSGGQQ
jgi:hypothetical protein